MSVLVACGGSVGGSEESPTRQAQLSNHDSDGGVDGAPDPALLATDAKYLALASTLTTLDLAVSTDRNAAAQFDDSPPIVHHVVDANAVQDAYRRIFAQPILQLQPSALLHCYVDERPIQTYELTFRDAKGVILRFNVLPSGNCQWLESLETSVYVADEDFWAHLAVDLGVDRSQLDPPPAPDGG